MMGAIARYFALMNEEQVDRVLTAQEWCAELFGDSLDGPHCLRGHAERWGRAAAGRTAEFDLALFEAAEVAAGRGRRPEHIFDRLARRFGLARAVVLVKQRAAARAEELRATPRSITTATATR